MELVAVVAAAKVIEPELQHGTFRLYVTVVDHSGMTRGDCAVSSSMSFEGECTNRTPL
jgi:hypothetical protein